MGCRVEGRGFEPQCGTFIFLIFPPFFSLLLSFFSPLLSFSLSSFPFSPSRSLRHFYAQAFFLDYNSLAG